MPSVAGAIALAADNRFEYLFLFCFYQRRNLLQACLLFGGKSFFPFEGFLFFFQVFDGSKRFPVLLGDLVEELLYTEHITVIGNSNGVHAVFLCLVNQCIDRGLSVQQRVLGVDV